MLVGLCSWVSLGEGHKFLLLLVLVILLGKGNLLFLLHVSEQKLVEGILVLLDVLGEAVVELDDLVLVLPTLSVSSSSVVVDSVAMLWLIKSPVSSEASLLLFIWNGLAGISCILESSLNIWVLDMGESL